MRHALILTLSVACLAGCFDTEDTSESYFRQAKPPGALPALTQASTETAARVDALGRQLIAANPQLGAKPQFRTIGSASPEIFHRGTTDIFITEGLVQQCTADDQLAAILALELGKMIRSREADVPNAIRTREALPPIDSRLGGDDRMGGTSDRSDWKEMLEYDKQRQAGRRRRPLPLPEPRLLAKEYLCRANFNPQALTAAEPILQAAVANTTLERQITGQGAITSQSDSTNR